MKTKIDKNKKTYSLIKNRSLFEITNERINSEFNGCTVIIPHVCNNINAFGAGFAADVSRFYPEVKMNFHMLGSKAKLGHTQYVSVKTNTKYKHSIIFANMIAQNKVISQSNPRPLNYAALTYCMNDINQYIKSLKISSEISNVEIHCPKFGSGLAGGNWLFIEELIKDLWAEHSVFVYIK